MWISKVFHIAPTRIFLGLGSPRETHDVLTDFEDVEHDLTTHEVGKALKLLLGGNGNVLERLTSPFQLVQSDEARKLKELALGAISKRFCRHYRGFFTGMCREHQRLKRAKTMLYTYRVALTGIHLMTTGEVEADLRANAPRYGFDEALELLEAKQKGQEKSQLPEAEDHRFRARWPTLEAALQHALAESPLPDDPPNIPQADHWLIDLRARDL